ncbi:WhiB family transcriptional regulator [Streptomyces beihaiensis]|uniref:WhiB family transcriptional regulator n=1 Tax=Streptomyces beihaiensis TaxID=2984495 RepID=A0ABT3TRD8_9ACTN|nr:WhiB family transcriptional regulator [Streptomyces beihaiensis]MCX3059586.1 WhiB family transcriptional regulator [Streptomyces beihaiensis]
MTTAEPYTSDWRQQAACAGQDTDLWFSTNPIRARRICRGCPVRPECLYDALQTETPSTAHGVRGGFTRTDRQSLPALPGTKSEAIAALRELPPPQDVTPPDERTPQPMSGTQTPPSPAEPKQPAPATDPAKLPVGRLLKWGDEHPAPSVQDQAARARAALAGLRQKYADEQELAALTSEAEQLEKRLAELHARREELSPARSKKTRRPVDYPAAEVRAWAAATGYDCPPVGRVPKKIVDAWRTAQGKETADA